MKEKLEQEKASSAAFSAAEKEALQKLEAAETDRDAAIARAGKAEAARETLEKELKMAAAVEKMKMSAPIIFYIFACSSACKFSWVPPGPVEVAVGAPN